MGAAAQQTVVAVIPARMASSRFPGKPLVPIKGMPMLWHIWRRCQLSGVLDSIAIATCDEEIRQACEEFGAEVDMTSAEHTRATDRVAEAAQSLDGEIVINAQGDEPLVHPQLIRELVAAFDGRAEVQCVNPVSPISDPEDLNSPNTVKVVFDTAGRALYFSRCPIPSDAAAHRTVDVFRQVPILAFRRDFLIDLTGRPETPLEIQESVDLLRALEYGLPIHVLTTEFQTVGVDVPDDVARVEALLETDSVYSEYR